MFKPWIVLLSSLFFSSLITAQPAETYVKQLGDMEVHFIGIPTSFLTPEVASSYKIERSRYRGLINIVALDTTGEDKKALSVGISGTATNLVGQTINLEFNKVTEGDAIYYLATVEYPNDETYRFDILINHDGDEQQLKFTQKFYVDE
ncbi:DUF4426 domain-containing protein [Thalassotalea mangrovi]|uniref:DUF4426 domain-containing protein n=1 Tax=Thalassotalea mangrovi TaxID=2572245 RepID=A0A4U1B8U2_9GAMM|nr:DUF4426 domain-containing protein [Thalassotalea mangrovi]TKB47120.1 DUF4426 domain-containing protein [Thalassotalea mangrovi]